MDGLILKYSMEHMLRYDVLFTVSYRGNCLKVNMCVAKRLIANSLKFKLYKSVADILQYKSCFLH